MIEYVGYVPTITTAWIDVEWIHPAISNISGWVRPRFPPSLGDLAAADIAHWLAAGDIEPMMQVLNVT